MNYFLDTNALLHYGEQLVKFDKFIISSISLQELENIKTSRNKDENIKYQARKVVRFLDDNPNLFKTVIVHTKHYDILENMKLPVNNDNLIIACAASCLNIESKDNCNFTFVTGDLSCKIIANNVFGMKVQGLDDSEEYIGYKEIKCDTQLFNEIHNEIDNGIDRFNLFQNQYLILFNKDTDKAMEFRKNKEKLEKIKLPPYKVIKGLNSEQRCAIDLLNNPNIPVKVIAGVHGSGKTMIATKMGLYHVLDKGNYQKILCVRNPIPTEVEIGFLPGSKEDKVGAYYNTITQYMEDDKQINNIYEQEHIEFEVVSFMKGINVTDTYVIVDEAEDLNSKLLKMLGTRIDSKSCIVFVGDWKQAENKYKQDNGLRELINKAKGHELFGCVVLSQDVRSDASKMFVELFD